MLQGVGWYRGLWRGARGCDRGQLCHIELVHAVLLSSRHGGGGVVGSLRVGSRLSASIRWDSQMHRHELRPFCDVGGGVGRIGNRAGLV